MPVMDGLKLGGQLLQIQPRLPIVLTTGPHGNDDRWKSAGTGLPRTAGQAIHRPLPG
jgi:CheY-like chemotaxis protein